MTTPTDPPAADPDAPVDDRLDRLESTVGQLANAVHRLVDGNTPARTAARGVVSDRLSTEADVADQVQRELARAREKDAAEQTTKGHGDRLAALEEATKSLTEKTPEPPQRVVERIMFGGRS